MPRNKTLIQNQRGNVFLIILLGIALFAALAFTISRGMRSDTTSRLSAREVELAASDILNYAKRVESAVERLRRKGVSENDISFANNSTTSDYTHTVPQPDNHKVFSASGGNLKYLDPTPWLDPDMQGYSSSATSWGEWMFSGTNTLNEVGTDCGTGACKELIIALHFVKKDICLRINEQLGIDNPGDSPPPERLSTPPGSLTTASYTGSFTNTLQGVDAGVAGMTTGCLTVEIGGSGDYYLFFHALIVR